MNDFEEEVTDLEVKNDVVEEPEVERRPRKKKRNIVKIIFNVILTIFSLVILFNAIVGVVNFSQISNDKDPYIFTEVETTTSEDKITKVYHQGLFNIIVEKNMKNGLVASEKWSLKPWFLK